MEKQPPSHNDECPNCRVPLEIVSVKIGLTGVTMQSICPNCHMVLPENPDTRSKTRRKPKAMSLLRKSLRH
jgi:hypothetical protein